MPPFSAPRKPARVNYIKGIVPIPKDFDDVKTIRYKADAITPVDHSGASIHHSVDGNFLS